MVRYLETSHLEIMFRMLRSDVDVSSKLGVSTRTTCRPIAWSQNLVAMTRFVCDLSPWPISLASRPLAKHTNCRQYVSASSSISWLSHRAFSGACWTHDTCEYRVRRFTVNTFITYAITISSGFRSPMFIASGGPCLVSAPSLATLSRFNSPERN